MGAQATIWASATSLGLSTRALARVLGVHHSVAARKLGGHVPWTLNDVEALNKALPPGQQLKLVAGDFDAVTAKPQVVTDPGRVLPSDPPLPQPGFTPSRVGLRPQSREAFEERRLKAISLRGEGLAYEEIAKQLGCSKSSVQNYLRWGRDVGILVNDDDQMPVSTKLVSVGASMTLFDTNDTRELVSA